MVRPGRPLRRSARRYSSQRDEFHHMEMPRPSLLLLARKANGGLVEWNHGQP